MSADSESARRALENARRAVSQGDRQAARRWAEQAVALSPGLEEPWLILAAVASPRASVAYLEQALRINPDSVHARKGMQWAVDRLRKQAGEPREAGSGLVESARAAVLEPATVPTPVVRIQGEPASPIVAPQAADRHIPGTFKPVPYVRWTLLTLFLLVVCISAFWAVWPGNASPVLAFLHLPQSTPQDFAAPIQVDKPTYTPTFTPTFTPTNTSTPTPTPTDTPTPTPTFTPTQTPLPTNTPRPLPTNTPPYVYPDYGGVRWIDVDLSEQRLYALEGDTVIASFLVSTGVYTSPTVTGQFHIYVKLLSTLMEGDGYYLPNVPYTMYFYYDYGIHGTYWHNNFGHPMSHGCINMYTPDAEWLFYWASVGTLVNIHY
jgi:lipoprotein-anchoring transpeptidase ErfK/SrfK